MGTIKVSSNKNKKIISDKNENAVLSDKNEKEMKLNNKNNQNINFEFMGRVKINEYIKKLKEIEGNKILILYENYFEVFDIKTRKKICKIKQKLKSEYPRYYDNHFDDFIELKNKDIILWSKGKIFYYKKFNNNYKLSQIINELRQQKNEEICYQIGMIEMYDLYNIIELENNILLSCNSIGLKIYNFKKKEYILEKVIPMFLDVEYAILIKTNIFLIIHHFKYDPNTCDSETYHKFAISLFDLKSNKITNIFNQETEGYYYNSKNYKFNYFLIKDTFFYQICDFNEIDENKKKIYSLNYHLFNVETNKSILNLKTSFCFISYYKDNLILAKDYENFNICYLNNDICTSVYKFNLNIDSFCVLTSKDLIFYGRKEIDEKNSIYCYEYYKYLEK